MAAVSIVIITQNESQGLANCISAARQISDDIIIVDNGSTDETLNIAHAYACRVYQTNWDGYGANKNKGIKYARYNWILSIDADEVPDEKLITSLLQLNQDNANIVYDINFRSYFGDKLIKYGSWGRSHHIRLFNRQIVKWTETNVHETLILHSRIKVKRIDGNINHYSVANASECIRKAIYYAKLSAKNYYQEGKTVSIFKLYLSPVFSFIRGYFLFFGFLDGKEGLIIAQSIFKNKRLKYYYLYRMNNKAKTKYTTVTELAMEYSH